MTSTSCCTCSAIHGPECHGRPDAIERVQERDPSMTLVLHDPSTYAHGFPCEAFREFRDHEPVSHHDHPAWERGYWALARHADVQRVSRDWTAFKNAPHPFLPDSESDDAGGGSSLLLISLDPPDHSKLRKII